MKLKAHSKAGRTGRHVERHRRSTMLMSRPGQWPAPDPAARVVLDPSDTSSLPAHPSSTTRPAMSRTSTHRGELIVAAGLGGILVSVGSAFVKLVDLPSLSEVAIGTLGGALVLVGVISRRRHVATEPAQRRTATKERLPAAGPIPTSEPIRTAEPLPPVERPPVALDLPSLTGQISHVLAELRHKYGMAYRTRTWIEDMLPAYGAELDDPALARALLAVAALDAGGIRADVSGLSEAHTNDAIIAAGTVVLAALRQVREACEESGSRPAASVRSSDPSRWPVSER